MKYNQIGMPQTREEGKLGQGTLDDCLHKETHPTVTVVAIHQSAHDSPVFLQYMRYIVQRNVQPGRLVGQRRSAVVRRGVMRHLVVHVIGSHTCNHCHDHFHGQRQAGEESAGIACSGNVGSQRVEFSPREMSLEQVYSEFVHICIGSEPLFGQVNLTGRSLRPHPKKMVRNIPSSTTCVLRRGTSKCAKPVKTDRTCLLGRRRQARAAFPCQRRG
jgi:hypothetical protein